MIKRLVLSLALIIICGVLTSCAVGMVDLDFVDIHPMRTPPEDSVVEQPPIAADPLAAEPMVTPDMPSHGDDPNGDDAPPLTLDWEYDPNRPAVALTFDDGPSSSVTPTIIDVLKENNARATFFVLGEMAIKAPGKSKR